MKCSMCDFEFDEAAAVRQCSSCAVFGGCQKVRCPRCGYEGPRETPLIRWLRSLWTRRQNKRAQILDADGASPLSHGKTGSSGTVWQIATTDQSQMQKLMAMGLLPGVNIRLLRKFPSFVFQVDYSQFTIDKELAGKILVKWTSDEASSEAPGRRS